MDQPEAAVVDGFLKRTSEAGLGVPPSIDQHILRSALDQRPYGQGSGVPLGCTSLDTGPLSFLDPLALQSASGPEGPALSLLPVHHWPSVPVIWPSSFLFWA